MKWDELGLRAEDPCDQVIEYFDRNVPADELHSALNALSRQGFVDIEYSRLEEVDKAYLPDLYNIKAWRLICACGRKLNYLKAD